MKRERRTKFEMENSRIENELAIFFSRVMEYLPKSLERIALGDEKIFMAVKKAYIEFRPILLKRILSDVKVK